MFKFLYKKWKYLLLILGLSIGAVMAATPEPNRLDKISAIQDTIKIDEIEKTIAVTDKNEGEQFIIKVDYSKYGTLGGDIMVYSSITLVEGGDQYAHIFGFFPKGMYQRSLEKFVGNNIVYDIIPATATTTEQSIPRKVAVWESVEVNTRFKVNNSNIDYQNTKNRKPDKVFKDYFEINKTNYYRSVIRMPLEVKDEEWSIGVVGVAETFGYLDPNNWVFEDGFNSDTKSLGNLNGQGWSGATNFQVVTTDLPPEGDQHVVNNASANSVIVKTITEKVSGTIYFSMKVSSVNANAFFNLQKSGSTSNVIKFRNNNIDAYDYDAPGWITILSSYSINTDYRIGIAFEAGAGGWDNDGDFAGLSADTWRANIDGGAWSAEIGGNNISGVNEVGLQNQSSDSGIYVWWDFISPGAEIPSVPVVEKRKVQDIIWF